MNSQPLKQSTAAVVLVGPILNADGTPATTGPVIGDFSWEKNGGTLTALASTATCTHKANGNWELSLRTSDVDTLGRFDICMTNTTYGMQVARFTVIGATLFDQIITNGTAWGTSTLTQTQVSGGAYDVTNASCLVHLAASQLVLLTAGQGVTVSGEGRNLGDYPTTATIKIKGHCALNGAAGTPVFTTLEVYQEGSTTQQTLTNSVNGTVVTADYDSVTGQFEIEIALSNAGWSGFFAAGSYTVKWTAGTVGGTAIGYARVLGSFTLNLSAAYTSVAAGVVVNSGTVTTVTNQLTAAAIATGVWQDATASDFTTTSSIGKALFVNAAPGATGGHLIAGANAATTFATLTSTGAFTINGTATVAQTGNSYPIVSDGTYGNSAIKTAVAAVPSAASNAAATVAVMFVDGATNKLKVNSDNTVNASVDIVAQLEGATINSLNVLRRNNLYQPIQVSADPGNGGSVPASTATVLQVIQSWTGSSNIAAGWRLTWNDENVAVVSSVLNGGTGYYAITVTPALSGVPDPADTIVVGQWIPASGGGGGGDATAAAQATAQASLDALITRVPDTIPTLTQWADGKSVTQNPALFKVNGHTVADPATGFVIASSSSLNLSTATGQFPQNAFPSGFVVTVSPQDSTSATVTIFRGDDYTVASLNRPLTFTNAAWPDITGGTITLTIRLGTFSLTVTGAVVGAHTCRVELTSAQTATLSAARYVYQVTVTLGGKVETLAQGRLIVE